MAFLAMPSPASFGNGHSGSQSPRSPTASLGPGMFNPTLSTRGSFDFGMLQGLPQATPQAAPQGEGSLFPATSSRGGSFAAPPAMPPQAAAPTGGAWSAAQSAVVQEAFIRGRVQILDGVSSVQAAVDGLNKGMLASPEGICAVYSTRQGTYYLLWRAEKAALAQQLTGQQAAAAAPVAQPSSRAPSPASRAPSPASRMPSGREKSVEPARMEPAGAAPPTPAPQQQLRQSAPSQLQVPQAGQAQTRGHSPSFNYCPPQGNPRASPMRQRSTQRSDKMNLFGAFSRGSSRRPASPRPASPRPQ